VLENIAVVQEDLLQVQDETSSSSNLQTFKINRHKEHRLHFVLRLLERAEMRLMLAEYKSIFATQLTALERTMLERIQKLENEIRQLSRKTDVPEQAANEAYEMASTVENALQETNEELAATREAVGETARHLKSLTRSVDVIDNRARANNAIVYGLQSTDPKTEVTSLLRGSSVYSSLFSKPTMLEESCLVRFPVLLLSSSLQRLRKSNFCGGQKTSPNDSQQVRT
jgi:chromosome segregation ATPase